MPSGPTFKPAAGGGPSAAHTAVAEAHKALAANKAKKHANQQEAIATGKQVAGSKKTSGGKPSVAKHAVGGAASGASTGAMVGNIIPGIGTAIGGAVGAGVGAVGGAHAGHKAKQAYAEENRQGGYRKLLIAEFVVCMIITALSPLTDKHQKESGQEMAKRYSAVAIVFMILGFTSSMGRSAAKMTAAFGGIITIVLLISDRDIFFRAAKIFNEKPKEATTGPGPTPAQIHQIDFTNFALGPGGATESVRGGVGVPDPGVAPPGANLGNRTTPDGRRNGFFATPGTGGGVWV